MEKDEIASQPHSGEGQPASAVTESQINQVTSQLHLKQGYSNSKSKQENIRTSSHSPYQIGRATTSNFKIGGIIPS